MAAMQAVGEFQGLPLLRPLLAYSRQQLESYAARHRLSFVDDESNQDPKYSRNFIRQQLMPILQQRWPAVAANLARAASHCHEAELNLAYLSRLDVDSDLSEARLHWPALIPLGKLRIANVLQNWFRLNQVRMPSALTFQRIINELLLARSDSQPQISWDGWQLRRYQQYLYLLPVEDIELPESIVWDNFPQPLRWGARELLITGDLSRLTGEIVVKRRQGGERIFYHGQHKSLKKLLQDKGIPPWERERLALIYVNGELVLVPGVVCADGYKMWGL